MKLINLGGNFALLNKDVVLSVLTTRKSFSRKTSEASTRHVLARFSS